MAGAVFDLSMRCLGTELEDSQAECFMEVSVKKVILMAAVLLIQGACAQAGEMELSSNEEAFSSYEECTSTVTSRAGLISRDTILDTCSPYLKTAYDSCQAFLISDGKWEQMFVCAPELKAGEVILQSTGAVVEVCSHMNWNCDN